MELQGTRTIQGCALCAPPRRGLHGARALGGAFETDGIINIPRGQMLQAPTYSLLKDPPGGSRFTGAPKSQRQIAAARAVGVEGDDAEVSGWLSLDWGKVVEGIDQAVVKVWDQIDKIDARNARRDQNRIALSRLADGADYMPLIVGGGLIAVALMVRKSRSQVVVPNGAFVAQ